MQSFTIILYVAECDTQIISHPNNLFEIMSKEPVKRERNLHNRVQSKSGSHVNSRRGVCLWLWGVPDIYVCTSRRFNPDNIKYTVKDVSLFAV